MVSSNKSNICFKLRFYFDILLINNHSLTSLSCNMQPRRSDTYAATTLSSMCSPAFCRAAQKKILTSQNKSLMQWKQWIIKCKSWNLFFSPTLCGIWKNIIGLSFCDCTICDNKKPPIKQNASTTNSALTFAKLHFKWQHFFLYFSVIFASFVYRNINVFSTNPTPIFGLFQGVLTALL